MKAHWQYLRYVVRHKVFVFLAGLKTGAPLWRLWIHDWSKFSPAEWGAYVRTFYGPYRVGGTVYIRSFEGLNGPAKIVGKRRGKTSFEVEMLDVEGSIGAGQRFWAWDDEVVGLSQTRAAFDAAWLHHQHRNPHHWEHWLLRQAKGTAKALPMPEYFVREMVADWAGAGRAITGKWDVAGWYAKNRDVIQLHPDSRKLVESLLETCFSEPESSEVAA